MTPNSGDVKRLGFDMPETPQSGPLLRVVAVVTDGDVAGPAASRALTDLAGDRAVSVAVPAASWPAGEDYQEVVRRGLRFLDLVAPADAFALVTTDSLEAVPEAVSRAAQGRRAVLSLLIFDHRDYRYRVTAPEELHEELAKLALSLGDSAEFEPGPYSVQVYADPDIATCYAVERFTPRWMPEQAWVVAADIACALVDSVQVHCNARLRPEVKPSAIANAIADFLTAQAGSDWGLHYYTGSGVATFIDDIEQRAIGNGNPVIRGPSEHSLACSALARWTLDGAPFAIVATSGMHEEFRGTLANHVAVRTRGFIVCCDSRQDQWHPFQGTIHRTEDSRPSLLARGFPVVYIARSADISSGLAEAFAAYSADRGPVMVIAPRDVLQASGIPVPEAEQAPAPRAERVSESEVDQLAALLNSARRRLLCQVGPLSASATGLMYELARAAGIGLADSVAQPGTVSRYRDGHAVEEFIGTLSMYGYSARVYEYLYSEGALRPADAQSVMFVGTQIPQIDTPFSESSLRQLAPIQITAREIDRAPFAGLAVVGDIEGALRALRDRLDVDPGVLALRRSAITSTRDSDGDVIGLLPILPMTANYFFRRLRGVLDCLIREQDYRYVGVYDIGRVGLSAVNSLPRTDLGVSGWFGRGLMGDGLMALPGILTRRDANVLTFTGDGAVAMTPDIVPTLVQQVAADRSAFRHGLSIFRFVNGSHSVIRTYREGFQPAAVSGQTGVLSFTPEDYEHQFGSLTVRHRRVVRFDDIPFAEQLAERETINLYSVIMGHNNEGDGLSRFSSLGWQRDELSPKALAMAGVLVPSQAVTS
jgi:thiamine pyrophosphate-dependent acetolactate synthase large subunit-like protein